MKLLAPTVLAALLIVMTGAGAVSAQESPALENEGQAYAQHNTSPQQRARLAQAIALRDEAARLQAADGGTLSAAHLAYVRHQAALIEGSESTANTGSLIIRR